MICTILMYLFLILGLVFWYLALKKGETTYMALCVMFFMLTTLIFMSKLV